MALAYLDSRSPAVNGLLRPMALWAGSRLQHAGARLLGLLPGGKHAARPGIMRLLGAPMPPVPAGTLFGRLPACSPHQAMLIEPAAAAVGTVFYFPGCGSERLYARVALAAIHILIHSGLRVILPPPYLCCGFPSKVNAKAAMHRRQALRTAVILNQIRERFGQHAFTAVAVSCGTCRESLAEMDAGTIFNCPVTDVSRLAIDGGLAPAVPAGRYYHAPCHDTLDGSAPALLAAVGAAVVSVPHCCGEAGTLALSRPDIAAAMRSRKREACASLGKAASTEMIILTNCPACLTGLGRNAAVGFRPRHLAEELAIGIDGENWLARTAPWRTNARAVTF
jgi:Fe-S oxidoreductase